MFDKKTVLVCSALLLAGGLASPQLFPLLFIISITGMVAVIALPFVRFFVSLSWNLLFKHLYNKIESKSAKSLFKLFLAPPKKYR